MAEEDAITATAEEAAIVATDETATAAAQEPAQEVAAAPSAIMQAVDIWGFDLIYNLGPRVETEAYNLVFSAIGDLKTRLAAIEKEG